LPDNTVLMLSVYRSYTEKDKSDKYQLSYFEKKTTTREWKNKHEIRIDNKSWKNKLYQKQKKLKTIGAASDVSKINKSITISAIVPINQRNPKFGKANSKLSGKAVNKNGIKVIEDEKNIYYPLNKTYQKAKYANPQSLKRNKTYIISKKTPFTPTSNPSDEGKSLSEIMSDINNIKYVPAGGTITVLSKKKIKNKLYYHVKAYYKNGKSIGKGWIISTALLDQNLKIKK